MAIDYDNNLKIINKILEEIKKEDDIKKLMLERISFLQPYKELYEDCITFSNGKIRGLEQAVKILESEDL